MKDIIVYADWQGLPISQEMGALSARTLRGKEVFSFSYTDEWLLSAQAQELDPDLKLYEGPQYLADDKPNFGLFLDSSPDRWGRMLMDRREALRAKQESRPYQTLLESDYLLGVNDTTRMGALRFKTAPTGPFLAAESDLSVPPFALIRTLEAASLQLEREDTVEDESTQHWLNLLIAPGSSLGGARPKANVRDPEGNLWIAKFPSKNDVEDTGAWEYVANQLAAALGIRVPEAAARQYTQRHHTFLSKRFDRNGEQRIHFASAMTLLGYQDGYDHVTGGSYLELVELIERYGAAPTEDLRELWKRVLFSVLIANTDDHLRNHGFLLSPAGWRLAPAYDLNPNPTGRGLSLNISDVDNRLSTELCLSVAEYFRWSRAEAQTLLAEAREVISSWSSLARDFGISTRARERMAPAFEQN
jgi:serine/threonine-protein kinase HipA